MPDFAKILEILSKNRLLLAAAAVIVITVICTGCYVKGATWVVWLPGGRWPSFLWPKATTPPSLPSENNRSSADAQAAPPTNVASDQTSSDATSAPIQAPEVTPVVTPTVLVIPLGMSEDEANAKLGDLPHTWHTSEGGNVLTFSQEAFGTHWSVNERFVGSRAISATLTFEKDAQQNTDAYTDALNKQFAPVHDYCFGPAFLRMRQEWISSMQLTSAKLDPVEVDTTQQLDADNEPACPSNALWCGPRWYVRRGDWSFSTPGVRSVDISMARSSFVQQQQPFNADQGDRRFRSDKCLAQITYSLDGAPRPEPVSFTP